MNTKLDKLPEFAELKAPGMGVVTTPHKSHQAVTATFRPVLSPADSSHVVGLGEEASLMLETFEHERCVSEFLTLHAPRVIPAQSKILLITGEVTGDAVWLSAQGHRVTVAMEDPRALKRAKAFADDAGFGVEMLEVDLARAQFGLHQWDIVILYHLHLPQAYRSTVHQRAARALGRGGVMLLEESWLNVNMQDDDIELLKGESFFDGFLDDVTESESYTRPCMLNDFGATLHNLSIQEHRHHAPSHERAEYMQSISVIGFS